MTDTREDWSASAPHGVEAFYFDELDSTNARAVAMAEGGHRTPLWLVAGAQTAGRGRRGRVWTSATGNLYASHLCFPRLKADAMGSLPFALSLAIRDTFIALGAYADGVQVKWPNDVLIGGRKASGILVESAADGAGGLAYLVIGIGLNLAHHPADAQFPATDIKTVTGQGVSVREAFAALAVSVERALGRLERADWPQVREEWLAHAWGLGERRVFQTATDRFEGRAETLGDDGGLVVSLDGGGQMRLYAGDIFPVADPKRGF